jgi:hypothetical protein
MLHARAHNSQGKMQILDPDIVNFTPGKVKSRKVLRHAIKATNKLHETVLLDKL